MEDFMEKIFQILIMVMSMICLLLERCSCYQLIVVALLFSILFELNNKNKSNENEVIDDEKE